MGDQHPAWYSQAGCISASDPRRLGEEPPSKSHLLCGKNKIPPTWDSVISPGRKSVENFSETACWRELESSALRALLLQFSLEFGGGKKKWKA